MLVRDAGAEVLHVELDHRFLLARPHLDPAARLAVFHRVLHQVPEHLAEGVEIGHDGFIGGLTDFEVQVRIDH